MSTDITECIWLNATEICSLDHLVEVSGLGRSDVLDLVEAGVLEPSTHGPDPQQYLFEASCIVTVRTARRLRDDFELDAHGLTLALRLLKRIEGLEAELVSLRARYGGGPPHGDR
ncbi:chaperone modulator CbpM [Candidimonas nitroreducens]|uniref:MerR family transcriptional regulator n=1 Tax=Candidimonas nitroreducens TaxID=683354 RepID=A0A225N0T0_9BURK|nr:chaperone modulator CbpM [Candidimonas nitroreducens]OWT66413.1 hypothetical protein CEY11_01385 [Candidimonas nitroreducens]